MPENFYEVLEVKQTATQAEIREAYLNIAARYHANMMQPYFQKHPNAHLNVEIFKDLASVYDTLADNNRRIIYDKGLSQNNPKAFIPSATDAPWSDPTSSPTSAITLFFFHARKGGAYPEAQLVAAFNEHSQNPKFLEAFSEFSDTREMNRFMIILAMNHPSMATAVLTSDLSRSPQNKNQFGTNVYMNNSQILDIIAQHNGNPAVMSVAIPILDASFKAGKFADSQEAARAFDLIKNNSQYAAAAPAAKNRITNEDAEKFIASLPDHWKERYKSDVGMATEKKTQLMDTIIYRLRNSPVSSLQADKRYQMMSSINRAIETSDKKQFRIMKTAVKSSKVSTALTQLKTNLNNQFKFKDLALQGDINTKDFVYNLICLSPTDQETVLKEKIKTPAQAGTLSESINKVKEVAEREKDTTLSADLEKMMKKAEKVKPAPDTAPRMTRTSR